MMCNHEYAIHTRQTIVIMKTPKIEPITIVNTFFLLILATLVCTLTYYSFYRGALIPVCKHEYGD